MSGVCQYSGERQGGVPEQDRPGQESDKRQESRPGMLCHLRTVCFEPKHISTSTISNIPIPGAPSVEAILLLDVELPPDREKELCDQVWSGQVTVIKKMFMIMFMISCNSAIIGSCLFCNDDLHHCPQAEHRPHPCQQSWQAGED